MMVLINGLCVCVMAKKCTQEKAQLKRFYFFIFMNLFGPTFPDKRLNQTVFSATDGHC